jgi:hypothetical protein
MVIMVHKISAASRNRKINLLKAVLAIRFWI